ncbi:MAG: type II secretion system F family protein [Dehalococcoidia bacterium]|nr:type II secretion system F family protein [Dehalococcoidia bacterium]
MEALAAVLVGMAVAFGAMGLLGMGGQSLAQRVKPQAVTSRHKDEVASLARRLLVPMLGWLERRLGSIMPDQIVRDLGRSLERAGLNLSPASFLVQWVMGALAAPLMFTVVAMLAGLPLMVVPVIALLALVPGVVGPILWLQGRATRRQRLILRALPDFCDLVAISVEAGLGLEAAMARVAERQPGPLAQEVRKTLHEISLGRARQEALIDMGRRCGVDELNTFLTAIVQAEQLGVGIANTLRVQADYLRMQRRQRAEAMAQQAPVKMVFPLVFLIFPAMMLVLLGPAAIRLWETFSSYQIGTP